MSYAYECTPFYTLLPLVIYPYALLLTHGHIYILFRFDLLPFYSRLVATLHPCMPGLAEDIFTLLRAEFKWHVG